VDDPIPRVARLAHHERRAARHRVLVRAHGLEHAHEVVPGEDGGAVRAHVVGALVDANGPPALRERGGGDEPADAAARDLRVPPAGQARAEAYFSRARSIPGDVASSDVGSQSATARLTP